MNASIPNPAAGATMPAGVAAMMRWHPKLSRASIEVMRRAWPSYPLLVGGKSIPPAHAAAALGVA
ncbi:MAG: hypothetical protein IJI03_12455 [Rudaea sp.]|nr:hypothetical protein [Rudaea sp.]